MRGKEHELTDTTEDTTEDTTLMQEIIKAVENKNKNTENKENNNQPAPQNTEELINRATHPVIGDQLRNHTHSDFPAIRSKHPLDLTSIITITAVNDNTISFRSHGPSGESDHQVSRNDYEKLVRKTIEHGATFHPTNTSANKNTTEDTTPIKTKEKTEIISLNIAETKITFYDAKGNILTKNSTDPAWNSRFKIEGPGIDPEKVTKIILPPLDYTSNKPYTIEIHTLPHKPPTPQQPHNSTSETNVEPPGGRSPPATSPQLLSFWLE
jgi:hypothetical protein